MIPERIQENTSKFSDISYNYYGHFLHRQKNVTAQSVQQQTGKKEFGRTVWFPTRLTATSVVHTSLCSSKQWGTGRILPVWSLWRKMLIYIRIILFLLNDLVGKFLYWLLFWWFIETSHLDTYLMGIDTYERYWSKSVW